MRVSLLLGGFLLLAFILSAQAHADSPDSQSATSVLVHQPAVVGSLARGAARSTEAGSAQADRSVSTTVAAAAGSGIEQPVTGLVGTVQDVTQQVTHQVTTPVVTVIGSVGAGHHGSGHGIARRRDRSPRTNDRVSNARSGSASWTAGHPAGVPAARHGSRPGRGSLMTSSQTPVHFPSSARGNEHPVDSDSGAHHTGGAYAAFFAGGARVHLSAVAMPAAHGSAPLRRPSDISVQPD